MWASTRTVSLAGLVGHVVDVQVGARRFRARPEELVGEARDVMWRETVLAQAPEVEKYARKAGRTIPVAVLHPLD